MQAVDIVNRIKDILPKYTDDFSDIFAVTSLTRSASLATCTTAAVHGLTTGDYITVRGAYRPIALTSITRVDTIVTVVSASDHLLSDPSLYGFDQVPIYVEIAGADSGYNGTFELLTVADDTTFTFKITTTPTTPATTAGFLLVEDQDGYNGYKQVTVTSTTAFTYEIDSSLQSPAQGTIEVSGLTRVGYAATAERISQAYSANTAGTLKTWLFVTVLADVVQKNDTVASDSSTAQKRNQSYWYEGGQDFSLYVIIPSTTSLLGGAESDTARSYISPILKTLANYTFNSPLVDEVYQPVTYVGNETDDYIKAYYVHRYDFLAKYFIQNADTSDFDNGTPLQLIDGTITDTEGMIFKPQTRQL